MKEDRLPFAEFRKEIEHGIRFSGASLWILIFAVFVASLGLNLNATPVVIGAMLISPLMGPILGLGLATALHDLAFLRRALLNYLFATVASLLTSTVYFLFSPLDEAHSELLARTTPNIYDVLIAVFGGLAAIVAMASKNRGNVLAGAAIATALMPPLCTAGYGLAIGEMKFFAGALYLYIINSVFISVSAFAFVRFSSYPDVERASARSSRRTHYLILLLTTLTLIPSIYLGYEMIQVNRFNRSANDFLQREFNDAGVFIFRKAIDAKQKTIDLYLLRDQQDSTRMRIWAKQAQKQVHSGVRLGFHVLGSNETPSQGLKIEDRLAEQQLINMRLTQELDSIQKRNQNYHRLTEELMIIQPSIREVFFRDSLRLSPTVYIIWGAPDLTKNSIIDTSLVNRFVKRMLSSQEPNIKFIQWLP